MPIEVYRQYMFTKKRTIEFLKKNQYPKVFVDVFEDKELPKNLFIWIGVPEELYRCSEQEQRTIIPEGYEPLWDDGNFDSIYCYRETDGSIVEVSLEGDETVFKKPFLFYAYLIYKAWEFDYLDVIEQWANALEFSYLHESLEYLNKMNNDDLNEEMYLQFIDVLKITN